MSYKVHFVGLVCFFKEQGARLALLPDGTTPPAGIDPHYPSILVPPEAVQGSAGWDAVSNPHPGIYYPPSSTIVIEEMDVAGNLDVSQHDTALPHLREIEPSFAIDPETAQTSARLPIRQGTLTVHSIPGGDALITEAVVPHEADFTVTVTPTDGSAVRTIRLSAGSEVIIGNMAKGGVYKRAVPSTDPQFSHFRIYEKLCTNDVMLPNPSNVRSFAPPDTNHWFFVDQREISLDTACTNTGCC